MEKLFKVASKEKVHSFIEKNYGISIGGLFEVPQFEDSNFDFIYSLPQWALENYPIDAETLKLKNDEYEIIYHDKSRNMIKIMCVPSQNYYYVGQHGRPRIKKDEREVVLQRLEKAKQFLFALCVTIQEVKGVKNHE